MMLLLISPSPTSPSLSEMVDALTESSLSVPIWAVAFAVLSLVVANQMSKLRHWHNLMIVIAWGLFIAALYFTPPLSAQIMDVRVLLTGISAILIGLLLYFIFWDSGPKAPAAAEPLYLHLVREVIKNATQNSTEVRPPKSQSQRDSEIWHGIKSAWEEAVTLRIEWNQNDSDPPLQKTEEYLKRTLAFAESNLTINEIRKLDSPFEQAPNFFDPTKSRFEMVNYLWGRLLDYERHLQEIMQTFTLHPQAAPPRAVAEVATIKPARLKISHDIECVIPRTFQPFDGEPVKGLMHHLRVECVSSKSRVINCRAVLKRLEKNGKTVVSASNLPFKFHPSQFLGSEIKTINYRDEQYLELVWLPLEVDAEIMVDFESADLQHKPLDKQASYSAFIVFTGDNIDGQEVVIDVQHEERGWGVSKRPSAERE